MAIKFGSKGSVYFIQETIGGYVKIGFSKNPVKRLFALQTSSPFEYKLLGIHDADDDTERKLHWKFRVHRYRGEWFKPHKNILNYIEKNCKKIRLGKGINYMDFIARDKQNRELKHIDKIKDTDQLDLFILNNNQVSAIQEKARVKNEAELEKLRSEFSKYWETA